MYIETSKLEEGTMCKNSHPKCLQSTNFEGFHRAKPLAIAKHCCVCTDQYILGRGTEGGGGNGGVTQLKVQHIAGSWSQNNCGTTKS